MRQDHKNEAVAMIAGIGIGAAVMYFLDPQRGNARRSKALDQTAGTLRSARRDLEVTGRDLRNRSRGVAAEVRQRLTEETVDDAQLQERVRAELGHHVDSLRRVEVEVADGYVTLSGEVAPQDHDEVVRAARGVRGVEEVEDQLTERRR